MTKEVYEAVPTKDLEKGEVAEATPVVVIQPDGRRSRWLALPVVMLCALLLAGFSACEHSHHHHHHHNEAQNEQFLRHDHHHGKHHKEPCDNKVRKQNKQEEYFHGFHMVRKSDFCICCNYLFFRITHILQWDPMDALCLLLLWDLMA